MRLRVVLLLFFFGFLAVMGRLFSIQVLNHEKYQILAEKQRTGFQTIPARRGKIYASGGVLVTNEDAFLLFADPSQVEEGKKVAKKITPLLLSDKRFFSYNPLSGELVRLARKEGLEKVVAGKIEEILDDKERYWVTLAHRVPRKVKEKIEALGIEGLGFEEEPRRLYPERSLAANLLGFVASGETGEDQGYFGLEGFYNGDLKGVPGDLAQEYSASGEPILMGDYSLYHPQDGSDLHLTIDRNIQGILEKKIKNGVQRYGAKAGSFVVLEPQTGRVLAMGNYPTFNPGNFNPLELDGRPKKEQRNMTISATYEPGSVMKSILMAAAIDTGAVKPSTTFIDDGPVRVGGYTIDTWDGRHYGKQTMIQLLQKSNNVGAAKLALDLGRDVLRAYFLKFGFGEITGVDLEGEEKGMIKPRSEWREVDLATAGFGQGVAVTPLQMANAVAVIANGGMLMEPYVVEAIVSPSGEMVEYEPEPVGRAISAKASEKMAKMLLAATEGGEARAFISSEYRIAGKTGTAQIPTKGGYDPHKTNVTFVGFLPKDRSFVMLLRLERPTTSTYSADTVVPLWVEAMEAIAPLFGVKPDK
jgi:cell division protein FtsI/penicillin-binding protein 2